MAGTAAAERAAAVVPVMPPAVPPAGALAFEAAGVLVLIAVVLIAFSLAAVGLLWRLAGRADRQARHRAARRRRLRLTDTQVGREWAGITEWWDRDLDEDFDQAMENVRDDDGTGT